MAKLLLSLILLATVLVQGAVAAHLTTVHAVLWVNGMRSTVTFTASGGGSSFSVDVTTPYTFTINELPIDYTKPPMTRCDLGEIGSNITSPYMFSSEASSVAVPIAISRLAFRSLVVYNGSSRVGCGNIVPFANVLSHTVLKAVFTTQVAGTVYVIQVDEDTYLIGKLFSTTGAVTANYRMAYYNVFTNFYDAANGTCPADTQGTTILDAVSVQESPSPYATGAFYVYSTAFTATALNNRTLGLVGPSGMMSCALLQTLGDVGTAPGSTTPQITQLIPFEYAFVQDNSIRQYEVYTDAQNPGAACSDRTVYDPLNVGSTGSAPAAVPVGDLSRKGSVVPNYIPEVPTLGRYTIVGRRLNDSMCSFLRPSSTKLDRVIMATVTFDAAGVSGTLVFRQMVFQGGILGPTFITQGLFYGVGSAPTVGHNWHVHQRRRASDGMCRGPVGGHYNPFNVNLTKPAYTNQCGPDSQLRCEMGDQSGKHGKLTIASLSSPTVLFDDHLHLTGPFTILGRSIVVHDHVDGSYLTCANIEPAILSATAVTVSFPRNSIDSQDLNFRINLASTVATVAGVPQGEVLVYDVASYTISTTECLRATLRMTGRDSAAADRNAEAVQNVDVTGLGAYSLGNICGTSSSGFAPKVSVAVMVILALIAFAMGW
jgi:hypothetical protein